MKIDLDSISLMRFLTKIPLCLVFSGLTSILFPAAKTFAQHFPFVSTNTVNLNIDYEQCAAKASQAANIVLTEAGEPSLIDDGIISFFGQTDAVQTILMCIQNGQGSIFAVVSNGDSSLYQVDKEVSSVVDRLTQVMSSDL